MQFRYENSPKSDSRVRKTERALISSMLSLLNENRFTKITVDRLCKEGQLSRATFYSHFTDKYDLLNYWFFSFWTYKVSGGDTYEDIKQSVNQLINKNKRLIKNLMTDADYQTIEVIQNFLCYALDIGRPTNSGENTAQKNIVVTNLYIGGIISYLQWQVRNNFPPDVPMINDSSFAAIKKLSDWAREQ